MADRPLSRYYVYFIVVWLAIWVPLRFYTPLALKVRYTYQLPAAACTNTLISDVSSFEAVREGLMEMLILVPFSMCFMVWTNELTGWFVHLGTLFLGFIWSIMTFSYDIADMGYANIPPNDPNFRLENLARDSRWCLYWGGQPGTDVLCSNSAPCSGSPVDPDTFGINGPFFYRFIGNVLLLIMICFAFWLAKIWRDKFEPHHDHPIPAVKPIKYNIKR